MAHGTFGTAITCMDGRVQAPTSDWLKQRYHLDFVDMITEAGPDLIMAGAPSPETNAILAKARISVEKHGSKIIAVVGHHDCAGNPVSKEGHLAHIRQAVAAVRSWGFAVDVIGLWIGEQWQVEKVQA
ncbi:MAG: carbonic anhydrase [Anaerolineae bacterium]